MKRNQKGFTIIELMMATTVLSIILVMVSVAMINISNLYYRGINQVKIQNNIRAVSDEIAQELELSGAFTTGGPLAGLRSYCIGSTNYTYRVGVQVVAGAHALWRSETSPGVCTPDSFGTQPDDTEIVTSRARLTHFEIQNPSNAPFAIIIGMAYGDPTLTSGAGLATRCRADAASVGRGVAKNFCSTAFLTTRVVQRL